MSKKQTMQQKQSMWASAGLIVALAGAFVTLMVSSATAFPPHPPSFEEIDTDADRVISEDEFAAFELERRARHFARLDQDGDGSVDFEEFENARPRHRRGARSERGVPSN